MPGSSARRHDDARDPLSMSVAVEAGDPPAPNHPRAWIALLVAFMLQATTAACLYGPFAVLLSSVEARTGAQRDLSSLGMLLVSLTSAVLAPFAGNLANRYSLRGLATLGVCMGIAGYLILGLVPNIYAYLVTYGLLIGGGMAFTGIVIPAMLVTNWYGKGRGRALGILHMPLLALVSPLTTTFVLKQFGAQAAYFSLAGIMAVNLLFLPLLVDRPDGTLASGAVGNEGNRSDARRLLSEIMRSSVFWTLALATAMVLSAGSTVSTHLVPMVMRWGLTDTEAATLISAGSLSGAAGAFLFGWLADRIGGALALVVCCIDVACLCALLLLEPGYVPLIVIVSLLGLHLAGAVPALTLALSKAYDPRHFGVAIGLATFVFMAISPFMAPVAGALYVHYGSYQVAIVVLIALAALGVVLAWSGRAALARAMAAK